MFDLNSKHSRNLLNLVMLKSVWDSIRNLYRLVVDVDAMLLLLLKLKWSKIIIIIIMIKIIVLSLLLLIIIIKMMIMLEIVKHYFLVFKQFAMCFL